MIDLDVLFQYIELREQGHSAKGLEEVVLQDTQEKCNKEYKKVMDDLGPRLKKAQEDSEIENNRLLQQVSSIDIAAPSMALLREYRSQVEELKEVSAKISLALTEEIASQKAMSLLKQSAQARLNSLNSTLAATAAEPKWVKQLDAWGRNASETVCINKRRGKS